MDAFYCYSFGRSVLVYICTLWCRISVLRTLAVVRRARERAAELLKCS